MSGAVKRVDVLAVMRDAVPCYLSRFGHADFDSARVAVDELIEAAEAVLDAPPARLTAAYARLTTAVANVHGGAA